MKKHLKLLIFGLFIGFVVNVMADSDGPHLARYALVITNKDGAVCYDYTGNNYQALNKKIEYNKVVYTSSPIEGKYISVDYEVGNDNYEYCTVLLSDVKTKDSSFSIKDDEVSKIEPVYAVILAQGGLNMRKGPSTLYSKISLIPQYSIVTLNYRAGDLWYYATYQDKKGWITSDNYYLGYNNDYILISAEEKPIYSDKQMTKKIGTIPKLTDIVNYIVLDSPFSASGAQYYVNYNGTKGFIGYMDIKVSGQLKLLKDSNLYVNGKVSKTLKAGNTYKYSISFDYGEGFYLTDEKGVLKIIYDDKAETSNYEIIGDTKTLKKTKGFIGEGLFGEKVDTSLNKDYTSMYKNENIQEEEQVDPSSLIDKEDKKQNEVKEEIKKQDKINKEYIIIGILSAIILSLCAFITIKLIHAKKKNKVEIKKEEPVRENIIEKETIEPIKEEIVNKEIHDETKKEERENKYEKKDVLENKEE